MSEDDELVKGRRQTLDQELQAASRLARKLRGGRARVKIQRIASRPKPTNPKPLANGRTGSTGRRTFHAKLKAMGSVSAGIGYARYAQRLDGARTEELATDRDGSVVGGMNMEAFQRQAMALETAGRARREWKATTYALEIELPSEFTAGQMRDAMTRISAHLAATGHGNVWGVHSHNQRGQWQPHGHLAILASDTAGQRRRPVEGGAEMMRLRQAIAEAVNITARHHGVAMPPYDGGGFDAVGVSRAPRERLPVHVWKSREDRKAGKKLSRARQRMAEAADTYDKTVMPARQKAKEEGKPLPGLPRRAGAQIRILRDLVARQVEKNQQNQDALDKIRRNLLPPERQGMSAEGVAAVVVALRSAQSKPPLSPPVPSPRKPPGRER